MTPPVPLIPGFNPDPSIVRVGDDYYLVTSTFEYLPGIPVYHSTDLVSWTKVGHVITRRDQLQVDGVPTGGGVWAPTIRFRDGVFYVIVTDAMGRGTLAFTATDPAGPWSDGLPIEMRGIDPDLAWDQDGTCYLTFSGLYLEPASGNAKHLGIQQVRIDLTTGRALEEPRSLWSGTGLIFPEAPHLYRIGGWWYLLLAEGGTERGHAISIARSTSAMGPFEGCSANPLLTATGTDRPVQCSGHGDLVLGPDGQWWLVLLGVWVRGMTRSFGSLGRETYITPVNWTDEGWPIVEPPADRIRTTIPAFVDVFPSGRFHPDWIGIRRLPSAVSSSHVGNGVLLRGEGRSMDHPEPTFVGRRQTRHDVRISATIAPSEASTVCGLTLRYDEQHHYDIELQPGRVVGRAVLPFMRQEHVVDFEGVVDGPVALQFEMRPPARDYGAAMSSDLIDLVAVINGVRHVVSTLDGRYLSAESACSFTGRVAGVYCVTGQLVLTRYTEEDLFPALSSSL
jgi:xylan 1,4-beta-xylosidase